MSKRAIWTALLSAALVAPVLGAVAVATPSDKVRLCHATGSASNPYVSITVNTSGVDESRNEDFNGHGDHAGDIIPPFGDYPGLNWAEGQGIWGNGCTVVVVTPTPTATPTETPTPTGSATPEGSETPTPTPTQTTPTKRPTPSATPTPTKTPKASVTPTPRKTTPSATPTPRKTTPPVVVTTPPKKDLPTCEQVAAEQAGKTYAKDSPQAAGIPCEDG